MPVGNSDPLEVLRGELDRIDEKLLDIVRQRIECCVRIADYKRENDVPMMQPHRIGIVQQRAAEYGAAHGVDRDFLRRLYDVIVDETCRVEDLVIAGPAATFPKAAVGGTPE
ncbi:chorismate mutase family protein [Streptomyces hundungensis]|uniref:chorismate mutase family protein n=1 Tax=Streptomyces hundungensis TaxID=1077946 RepID=UPI0033ECC53B